MAAASGIWNHVAASQAHAGATAMDSPSDSSSSSSDSATISSNDFLSLLVTEMQNQDPTADTDPNEYINQLVNVNSLEQLISINQTLTDDSTGSTGSTSGSSGNGTKADSVSGKAANSTTVAQQAAAEAQQATANHSATHHATAQYAPGNLGIPSANPSAERVAQSLAGKHPVA